ncbi:TraV family lipoprotein [Photobacterium damselae]|uniref:TraV family lipoprotein n=1 Tax=Photobacterium damselae TaxID=38293 RepID=UPI0010766399|nr:TraV family lipoprotein [Photobacterium damselae]MBE8127675.1 TraV family lipoprotein [Photobacterium damselae subsp. piscicida]NVO58992.1 TraV family lipoprotein [Photobacterium damselae subsp. damselae]WIH21942.1 TraV family lipoprotein [Photobacterium damselae]
MKNYINRTLLAISVTISLSGCSSFLEVGEPPTECPYAIQEGLPCTSAREVWELTNKSKDVDTIKRDLIAQQKSRHNTGKSSNTEESQAETVPAYPGGTVAERRAIYTDYQNNYKNLPASDPMAILHEAKVLRVLVNAWEDKEHRLHMPGYTYVEISPRRWEVGRDAVSTPAMVTSLNVRRASLNEREKMSPTGDPSGMQVIQRQPSAPAKQKVSDYVREF